MIPWLLAVLIEAAKFRVSSLTLASDVIAALSSSSGNNALAQRQRWSHRRLLPLHLPEFPSVYAAAIDRNPGEADLVLVNFRRTPVEVRWREEELHIKRLTNACTATTIDTTEKASNLVQLPPATALIASLTSQLRR